MPFCFITKAPEQGNMYSKDDGSLAKVYEFGEVFFLYDSGRDSEGRKPSKWNVEYVCFPFVNWETIKGRIKQ